MAESSGGTTPLGVGERFDLSGHTVVVIGSIRPLGQPDSVFARTRVVAAGMVQRGGGRIVNIASVLGLLGEDLDAALLLLAGPGSGYLTGQTLVVDGGLVAGW